MSLKDYHALVGNFWKGKASKSALKEKSAFEPYHCTSYRPYMMNYHNRVSTKYERPDDLTKYKCMSPNCDQCEYELKRKSNSSLENIILKLKKSRHDDKDTRHFTPDVEALANRAAASSSVYKYRDPVSLRTLVAHNERVIHDGSRHDYDNEEKRLPPPTDSYSLEKTRSITEKTYDVNETNEKSSFVTLLEQQDDIQYASTLSMASILGGGPSASKPKDDEKVFRETKEKEMEVSKPGDNDSLTTLSKAAAAAADPAFSSEEKESSDKIAETKCDKCHKRFYRRSQLIRHISNHVVHECHKCNAFFYCVRKFKKHMSTHESYPCEFCEEEFYEASAWYHHRAKHTMVECSSCDMIFYNKTALLKHKFTHLQYICPVCRFPFSNLNHWISHRSCHKTFGSTLLTPLFSCRECSTTFPSQDTYMKHSCLHRLKKPLDTKRTVISKRDISDLIGVDQTAR